MPTTQRSKSSRSASAAAQDVAFVFPSHHHLVIATDGHVLSYDKIGLRKIFQSGSNGILTAKEARDGSGTLAVADSQTVVLHRIEDGLERSYRLKGSEGQIRQLEFSPDSKTLFFTTTLLHAVQSYSISEARLLEPGPMHNSMPTVMAISPLSHILLTASEDPPTVYLQNRSMGTHPLLLQPLASITPVVLAVFHPDRPNIFLLGFKDGTVAAYDATQIFLAIERGTGHSSVQGEELETFKSLHTVTTRGGVDPGDHFNLAVFGGLDPGTRTSASGARSLGVTGAAFIPAFRNRAITAGADGRCRVIDFEKGTILRTWHIKGPATALSLLPSKTGKRNLVAIGRLDGRVTIFDTSGHLLREFKVDDELPGRVVNVEWIKGPGPRVIGEGSRVELMEETWIELYTIDGTLRSRKTRSTAESTSKYSDPPNRDGSVSPSLCVEQTGTVFHRPAERAGFQALPQIAAQNYMDLFSPVKAGQPPPTKPGSPRRRTTPRPRARLSSSTFLNRGKQSPVLSPAATKVEEEPQSSTDKPLPVHSRSTHAPSSSSPGIRPRPAIHFAPSPRYSSSSTNSKILADIKKAGELGVDKGRPGNLSIFAPYLSSAQGTKKKKSQSDRRTSRSRKLSIHNFSPKKNPAQPTEPVRIRGATGDDDIWLTAEEEELESTAAQIRRRGVGSKTARRLVWPSERRDMQDMESGTSAARRPSIQLEMSEPVSKINKHRPTRSTGAMDLLKLTGILRPSKSDALENDDVSPISEVPPSMVTGTEASFQTLYNAGNPDHLPTSPLPPGFAQSYRGPVKVDRYLPRQASLAFAGSPPGSPKKRAALSEVSGVENRRSHDVRRLSCEGCALMKDEMDKLKHEVAELRRLVKGKGRADV